jgi:TetR/AcrR family transcriptional regulator, ethionamide resistance regulator
VQAAVLRATEELLAEGASFGDLGVERIATRAGISRTAFYFYFRDKRELLLRLTEDVTNLLYQQAESWWSGDGDPEEEIRETYTNIVEVFQQHGVLLRAIVEVSTYDEELAAFWRGIVGRFAEAGQRRIEREQQAGRALPGPARDIALVTVWMSERMLYEHLVQPDLISREDLVEALTIVCMRSMFGASSA